MKKRTIGIVIAAVLVIAIVFAVGKKENTTQNTENEITVPGEPEAYPTEESEIDETVEENAEEEKAVEADTEESPKYTEEELENIEYSDYIEMSGEEQQEVFESYKDPEDFFDWYNSGKEEQKEQGKTEGTVEETVEETGAGLVMEGGVVESEDVGGFDE